MSDVDKWAEQFLGLREARHALKENYEKADKNIRILQEKVESKLLDFLRTNNLVNVKTATGTVHTTTRYTASLADADTFMKYVVDNQLFDLLERRASSLAVRDFVEQHKVLPPGCNLSAITSIGFRQAADKKPVTGTVTST